MAGLKCFDFGLAKLKPEFGRAETDETTPAGDASR